MLKIEYLDNEEFNGKIINNVQTGILKLNNKDLIYGNFKKYTRELLVGEFEMYFDDGSRFKGIYNGES